MTALASIPPIESLGAFAAALLFVAALVQWVRYRKCAYHQETGFWYLLVFGWLCIGLGFLGAMIGNESSAFAAYSASCLLLSGYLTVAVALLRLFSWSSHRHITST